MKSAPAVAALVMFIATPAFAGPAMDKCVSDTSALGASDPKAQCQCFVAALSPEDAAAYAEIENWESEATEAMKEAGAECFPELN